MHRSSKWTDIVWVLTLAAFFLTMGLNAVLRREFGYFGLIQGEDAVRHGWLWVCFGVVLLVLAWRIHVWYEDD